MRPAFSVFQALRLMGALWTGEPALDRAGRRLRTRGALLRRRAELLATVRAFFAARTYLEVETPIVVPSPGLDVHLSAFEVRDPLGGVAGWLAWSSWLAPERGRDDAIDAEMLELFEDASTG